MSLVLEHPSRPKPPPTASIAERSAPDGLTDADFQRVSRAVYDHCGITLNESKRDLVRARLAKEVRRSGSRSEADYLDQVLADPGSERFDAFIDAISTNLTSFFRENDHFEHLCETFLPEWLVKKEKAGDPRLLIWSAACSSGEEPYSLAMAVTEAIKRLPIARGRWDVRILATDISTRVLRIAKQGVYSASRTQSVPGPLRQAYFTTSSRPVKAAADDDGMANAAQSYEVATHLKSLVRFRHLNLIKEWPFHGPFDVVFCRNVMIYFDKPTQERLVARFHQLLRSGGLLVTGHSESLTGVRHGFRNVRPSIYEKS